ncbi:hypothetical protein F4780DRAFT_379540 [Xylariomycetidae sp. FL0641]|nr:hypothetical protein F4780DRAFT_379540 [Xylariomycetidae sp. FL0641]
MRPAGPLSLLLALAAGATAQNESSTETGQHPGWPRWCGKVYEPGYPSFDPGGHTVEPPSNGSTFLAVHFAPRYSLYLARETTASFVVSAPLSPWHGSPYANHMSGDGGGANSEPFTELVFSIHVADDADAPPLVQNRVAVNATAPAEFAFDLAAANLRPRATPYDVVLFAASPWADWNYTATSTLAYLPANPAGGSATKLDNLHGGLLVASSADESFAPLLPYGYYGTYDNATDPAAFVAEYTRNGSGLNAVIALASFPDTDPVYDAMDAGGLRFVFDLRGSYQNLTEVEARVNAVKHHPGLFAYWTADEPDGHQAPFADTPAAQSLIHALDPYHAVAITLNCADYYFGAYSAGGDILMADPYPIGINSSYSKWGTAVNATLGDCGCDDCAGDVQDVSRRWDGIARHRDWLGRSPFGPPRFHNPQVFHGEDYWFRDPTAGEARVMNALAFNRGVTGIFGWTWPGSQALFETHSDMAAVVTAAPVRDFLLGGQPKGKLAVEGGEEDTVDTAYWLQGDRMMVSVVNGGYLDVEGALAVSLPQTAVGVEAVPLGGLAWQVSGDTLVVDGLPAMSVSFVILNLPSST